MKEQRVKEDCGQAMEGRQHGEGCSFICQALFVQLTAGRDQHFGKLCSWDCTCQPGGGVRGDLIDQLGDHSGHGA